MNVSTEARTFPINQQHYRRGLTSHSSMFLSASPVAVSNKIRAIQARKSRITLPSYYDYTDIRPINITHGGGGITRSSATFSQITPEKLVERSKDMRLGRISARQNPRPSLLSTASPIEHSLVWPGLNSPAMLAKQPQVNSPAITPTALGPLMNKSTGGHTPDIHQHLSRAHTITRQPLTEQQNSLAHVERHKSLPKTKSSIPKAYYRTMSKSKSPFTLTRTQPLQLLRNDSNKQRNNNVHIYESEEDDGNNVIVDEEFEEYREKAIIKCADWLIKYVLDKKYDENND